MMMEHRIGEAPTVLPVPGVLPFGNVDSRRLANQIARVLHGTYGAQTGFRVIVRALTGRMLRGGVSEVTLREVFTRFVHENSTSTPPPSARPDIAVTASRARMLAMLVSECDDAVAAEHRRRALIAAAAS